jgi:hypothetical protein
VPRIFFLIRVRFACAQMPRLCEYSCGFLVRVLLVWKVFACMRGWKFSGLCTVYTSLSGDVFRPCSSSGYCFLRCFSSSFFIFVEAVPNTRLHRDDNLICFLKRVFFLCFLMFRRHSNEVFAHRSLRMIVQTPCYLLEITFPLLL